MEAKTTTLCADSEKEVNIAKSENEKCFSQLDSVNERFFLLVLNYSCFLFQSLGWG